MPVVSVLTDNLRSRDKNSIDAAQTRLWLWPDYNRALTLTVESWSHARTSMMYKLTLRHDAALPSVFFASAHHRTMLETENLKRILSSASWITKLWTPAFKANVPFHAGRRGAERPKKRLAISCPSKWQPLGLEDHLASSFHNMGSCTPRWNTKMDQMIVISNRKIFGLLLVSNNRDNVLAHTLGLRNLEFINGWAECCFWLRSGNHMYQSYWVP